MALDTYDVFKYKCEICGMRTTAGMAKDLQRPRKCKKCKIWIRPKCYQAVIKEDKCPKCGGELKIPMVIL